MLCLVPPLYPTDGPDFKEGFELNNRYLLMLDPDNLLYNFR